jgi:transcriptional regulator with XRE-family HTH domain
MSELGKNVKFLREKRSRMTQRQFGEKYGADNSSVSRWESGKTIPDPGTIKRIASDFGVSIDWLMGETKDHPDKLDLKEIKKALLEKELIYDGRELTKEQQDGIRSILLAVIEREEKKGNS